MVNDKPNKISMKSASLALILMTTPLAATAQYQYGDFYYQQVDGYATITGYFGPGGAVTIPANIYDDIDSTWLFVTAIGDDAFQSQTSLTNVTVPAGVTSIANSAFLYCTSLTAITIDPRNGAYSSANGVLFDKGQTTLITYPGGKSGSYAIPDSVNSVGEAAFEGCENLTSVTIPASVTNIGAVAFANSGLASVTIPVNVANIGGSAFTYCISLTNVTMLNGAIGSAMFLGCASLTNVTISTNVTAIGDNAFGNCTNLVNVTIPAGVTNIGISPFSYCLRLMAITVDAANSLYSGLDGVLFSKDRSVLIEYPGGKAGTYLIPGSVTNIGRYAFFGCYGPTNVTIPGSVTSLGDWAFANCASLSSVTVPASVTNIGYYVFYECYGLTSVTILGNLTNIQAGMFALCSRLTNITIPDSVTSIGDWAFEDCSSLTNLTIPGGVTDIGEGAFFGWTSLQGIFFKGNAPSFGLYAFDNAATLYYLPGASGWPFGGPSALLWNPLMQSSGIGPAGFGFNITGTADIPIVIEAATNLANATWVPLQSLNLTNGAFYFSDPNWTNYPSRFYRIRSP
jgi:hypothetical protein